MNMCKLLLILAFCNLAEAEKNNENQVITLFSEKSIKIFQTDLQHKDFKFIELYELKGNKMILLKRYPILESVNGEKPNITSQKKGYYCYFKTNRGGWGHVFFNKKQVFNPPFGLSEKINVNKLLFLIDKAIKYDSDNINNEKQ